MASPRVFVSSTCYDLGEVRDSLLTFIKSYHFEPYLSERGDVFYHPDCHTHESCVHEVQNCQLFILIIGGRFGGNYIADTSKSIVNAEYSAARESGIPIFCFVKKGVYEDHRVYQKNKNNKEIIHKIEFPSIEKQEYAANIFNFIDDVRYFSVNNGIFAFEFAREVIDVLGKQWAGMFCDSLNKRQSQKQFDITSNLLSQLTIVSKKTEDIIKNIYIHLDADNAHSIIESLDYEAQARQFFATVLKEFSIESIDYNKEYNLFEFDKNISWTEYLDNLDSFFIDDNEGEDDEGNYYHDEIILSYESFKGIYIRDLLDQTVSDKYKQLEELFSYYKNLTPNRRKEIIQPYISTYKTIS